MEDNRYNIIIKEIHQWKQNKLLPEKYCDFLLALYTQGENSEEKLYKTQEKSKMFSLLYLFLLLSLLPLSFFVSNILSIPFGFQLSILFVFFIISFWACRIFLRYDNILYQYLSLFVLLILALFITVFVCNWYQASKTLITFFIICNFGMWLWVSMKRKYKMLAVISVIAVISTFFYTVL